MLRSQSSDSGLSPGAGGSASGCVVSRIERRFAALREEGRAGLVTYLTAGDPDPDTSARLFAGLAAAGADLIEIGMPFSDPMADGPAIQEAGPARAEAGHDLAPHLGAGARAAPRRRRRPRSC